MNILIFAGSLREKSFNKKLTKVIVNAFTSSEREFVEADLKTLNLPVFDQDIEDGEGYAKTLLDFAEKMKQADAVIICTPEYNGSISSPLKNTVDWLSRLKPDPVGGKKILLTGTSPGALGAVQGLWHSRQPFEKLGAYVYPKMFGLPKALEAFNKDGTLADPKQEKILKDLVESFLNWKL